MKRLACALTALSLLALPACAEQPGKKKDDAKTETKTETKTDADKKTETKTEVK